MQRIKPDLTSLMLYGPTTMILLDIPSLSTLT